MGALKSSHCSRGHKMDEANLYHRGDGKRECLTCKRERNRGRKVSNEGNGIKKPELPTSGVVSRARDPRRAGIVDKVAKVEAVARREPRPLAIESLVDNERLVVKTLICGFEAYNDGDGETYRCGLPKHGSKVKHGNWGKI